MSGIAGLDRERAGVLVRLALAEDLGDVGDVTSLSVVPEGLVAEARIITKEDCVVAGLPVAEAVFKAVDARLTFSAMVDDGDYVAAYSEIARLEGDAASLLTGERTALNFLQRLCGIATVSARFAKAVEGSGTRILDTRKTTPGWRDLEKYAVRAGGGSNHRIGLYDRVLVKDNHRELAGLEGSGGIGRSVERARKRFPGLEIEVEADTLDEVCEAVEAGADYVLLDNMDDSTVAQAVELNSGRSKLEASGGITEDRLSSLAAAGVDYISCGALTHSVKAIDLSMEIIPCTSSS
ncbi:MAG: carboxylating nicotinate-nucleotide diphosphorylase [Victivallales bacterium]|nr:carboxylating nicotinate-nucleotide diphosphorylase [Victivallales bacterium]